MRNAFKRFARWIMKVDSKIDVKWERGSGERPLTKQRRHPATNVDGTPMVGRIDLHGRGYGAGTGNGKGRW